jgi:predicted Zn-dependent protease/transglutaminase-like putative cysteine protease
VLEFPVPFVRLRLALVPSLAVFPLLLLSSATAFTQTTPASPPKVQDDKTPRTIKSIKEKSPPDYSQEPFIFDRLDSVITYNADGTGTTTQTGVIKYQTDAAVHEAGVIPFPYAAREQSLTVDYMRVRKPDGRVIVTPADDIQDLPTQITQQAPLYSDSRVKQVPIKGLSAGDTVEYQFHLKTEHPAAPGHFWGDLSFLQDTVSLEQSTELRVPKDKYVKVVSKDVQPVITEDGAQKVYTWHTSHLDPAPKGKKKKKSAADREPSIQFTTFHDWAEVGAWYDALQKDRVEVTPEISAKSQELTKGLTTDEDKIKAIYTYVSTQFRYIGVDFGVGRYQPHHATEVLDNQYGDCKDKHTLLASLLKAAGYTAWPALIKPDAKLRPDVPSPAQFNHVITAVQLNGKTQWLDSTAETSPFGLLLATLRDQQALLIPDNAPAYLVTTPADPPYPMFDHWTATGTLSADGEFKGHFVINMRDDSEVIFRTVYRNMPRSDWDKFTQSMLNYEGFGGTVTNADTSPPNDLAQPFRITLDYDRKDFSDWSDLRIPAILPSWPFIAGKDDDKPTDPIEIGDFGETIFRSEITLPQGYSADLPAPTKLQNDFVDYSTTYSFANGVLTAERKFVVKKLKIPPSSWDEFLRWEKLVKDDEDALIQLSRPGEESHANEVENPEARDLIKQAYEANNRGDREAAQDMLDRAKALNPKQVGLQATYGYLYLQQQQIDKAAAAFNQEALDHPQNVTYNLQFVGMLDGLHRADDAIALARIIVKGSPNSVTAQERLAYLLYSNGHADEAVTVLQKAIAAPDATPNLKLQLAHAYMMAHRPSDAEPLLKSLIQNSGPEMLNNASYELIDAGLDLPEATDAAQKSLKLQEAALSALTLDHVSSKSLYAVSQIPHVWDTVGWAYFKAGQLDKAENFVRAAWVLSPDPALGVHLGEILEKQGKTEPAMKQYQLALASSNGREDDDTALARKRLGAQAPPLPPEKRNSLVLTPRTSTQQSAIHDLQEMRTVRIPKQGDQSGSAEFFILLDPSGPVDVQFISGDEKLRPAGDQIRKAKFNPTFPAGSQAKLIRRGVFDCTPNVKDCEIVLIEPNRARPK